jgi:ABC-type enterochelin transport system ATPase subunit
LKRCLLIGANGAGKSTILRVLSGRHLTKPDLAVRVLGFFIIKLLLKLLFFLLKLLLFCIKIFIF